jgi:Holliday junction resolvase RusA-like endonuclease
MKRRFKSKKYKEWIAIAAKGWEHDDIEINPTVWLKATYKFYMPLWCKNGNVKKRDVANYEKATSDFIGDNLNGFEDMMLRDVRLIKIDSERNEVECIIREIDAA